MDINTLITVVIEFFKTGLFAIGGGLATIPFLQDMAVKYGWFDLTTLSTMIAVSESTPGPIGINMATYVGYITLGPAGGIISTIALVTPSIIVILIIANMLEKFKESKIVKQVFNGIRQFMAVTIIFAGTALLVKKKYNNSIYNLSIHIRTEKNSILRITLPKILFLFYLAQLNASSKLSAPRIFNIKSVYLYASSVSIY